MDNNLSDSCGRVTRSLRKRLTSVDSENSSRPGTPISTKLTSISEIIASPSKSIRNKRRSSISGTATPVKTPAKRGANISAIGENLESITPARRSTRRRSVSVNETEDNSQNGLKIPTFPAFDEVEQSDSKTTRLTRSSSKSPQESKILKTSLTIKNSKSTNKKINKEMQLENTETNIPKKRKSGPKCMNINHDESESDVEVTVLKIEIEDIKNKLSNITTIELSDEELIQKDKANIEENELLFENSNSIKDSEAKENTNETSSLHYEANNISLENAKISNIEIPDEQPINESSHQEIIEMSTTSYLSKELINIEKQQKLSNDNEQENLTYLQDTKNMETELSCEETNPDENKINLAHSEVVASNINSKKIEDTNCLIAKSCTTPEAKLFLSEKVEIMSCQTLKSYSYGYEHSNVNSCKATLKKVEFDCSPSNDMNIKNVYPRTPLSRKISNRFEEDGSPGFDGPFPAKSDILDNHQNTKPKTQDTTIETNNEEAQIIDTEIRSPKCVNILSICETNTNEDENSYPEEAMKTDENETSTNEIYDKENSSPKHDKEELKWINPSVKGITTDETKLDVVVDNTNGNDCGSNTDYLGKQIQKSKISVIHSSEDEKEDEVVDDDYNELEELEQESHMPKHDFLDDEAMQVDDYESGDSMESEKRSEIEENEIPVDFESIGSNTTENDQDECDEEEDSENLNSFIVSDNEELRFSETDNENKVDGDVNDHSCKKNKKVYKRLLRQDESSSSSDEDVELGQQLNYENDSNSIRNNVGHENDKKRKNTNENPDYFEKSLISLPEKEPMITEELKVAMKSEKNSCEYITETYNPTSKLSENTILDSSKLSDSALRLNCSVESETEEEEKINASRKEILRNLNHSDRFNKSVRDLNTEIDTSPSENTENQCTVEQNPEIYKINNKLSSPDGIPNETCDNTRIQSKSNLGEVLITYESDAQKEFEGESDLSHSRKSGNYKKTKEYEKCQKSFTIDVTVKNDKLEAVVSDVNLKEPEPTSSSSSDIKKTEDLNSKNIIQENVRHFILPLGNPLIRTRRQSLALPTNPDMEIGSSSRESEIVKKTNRKSLGILSSTDFNPSQSLIDTIELQKNERNRLAEKRKHLSKSFCGASETHDNSIVEVDVCHMHKKSKLMSENSMSDGQIDSIEENISTINLPSKISSTPYEKTNKNNSYNERILRRCDEILEAANFAKLQSKTNNMKNKPTKKSKKRSKKKPVSNSSGETNTNDVLRGISKKINRKDKTKTALTQAIRAADVILGKNKKSEHPNVQGQDKLAVKALTPDVLESIGECAGTKKKIKKAKLINVHTSSTSSSAGNFMDLPQSPDKKSKKTTYIQLPTGKVSVEPVTPKKRIVHASNGMEFRESPISPFAVGFKVRKIAPTKNMSPSSAPKQKKRKQYDESFKDFTSKKSQWTQSGLFKEENVPRPEAAKLLRASKKTKKRQLERQELLNVNRNFKEIATMRPDIKRSNKREILLLKERRQLGNQY